MLYTYGVKVTDADIGDIFAFSLDAGPTDTTIDSSRSHINWTSAGSQVSGNAVTVQGTDYGGRPVPGLSWRTLSVTDASAFGAGHRPV